MPCLCTICSHFNNAVYCQRAEEMLLQLIYSEKMEVRKIKKGLDYLVFSNAALLFFPLTSSDLSECLSEDGLLPEQLLGKCLDNTWK